MMYQTELQQQQSMGAAGSEAQLAHAAAGLGQLNAHLQSEQHQQQYEAATLRSETFQLNEAAAQLEAAVVQQQADRLRL